MDLFNEIVSSRRECFRDATVNNLIKVGYHGWSGLILRGLEDENKQVHNYKAEARKRLVDEGYHIWGIVGDQWSKFRWTPRGKTDFQAAEFLVLCFLKNPLCCCLISLFTMFHRCFVES